MCIQGISALYVELNKGHIKKVLKFEIISNFKTFFLYIE